MSTTKIGENRWYAELDTRGRISLAQIVQPDELHGYRVHREPGGTIVLEPAVVLSRAEWKKIGTR